MDDTHVTGNANPGLSSDTNSLMEKVITGILSDDGFTLPTEECKRCLVMATSLSEVCRHRSPSCRKHAKWLVDELSKLIDKAKKRGSQLINEEKLWSTYHQLRISDSFQRTWEMFLDNHKLAKEPLLYQHITDQTFELLIKKKVPISSTSEGCKEQQKLTFEEENALRYVGGYVIRQLLEKTKDGGVQQILSELKDQGATASEGQAQEWINAIDRGGLTRITSETFQLFYAIEMCIRRHLSTDNPAIIQGNIKEELRDSTLKDGDVHFHWCLAGQIEGDDAADKTLSMIIDLWITIRANSFAKNVLEMYKQNTQKGTGKAKAIRSTLFS